MALLFTAPQRRVLGVLMEKALATPQHYPITLNAIVAGCNQKSNRNPVIDYSEGEVGKALHELTQMRLVTQAVAEIGARANRFQHEAEATLGWTRRQRAVMAELLLRGPQTLGDLRTRIQRMVSLPELQAVASVVAELTSADPPVVVERQREPGQSANRFDHTLYQPVEKGDRHLASSPSRQHEDRLARSQSPFSTDGYPDDEKPDLPDAVMPGGAEAGPAAETAETLVERVDRLEREVEELAQEVVDLRRKLDESSQPPGDS